MIDQIKQIGTEYRGRILLALALVAWLIACGFLITHAPDEATLRAMGTWLSKDHRTAIHFSEVYRNHPSRTEVRIRTTDLATGKAGKIDLPGGSVVAAAATKSMDLYLLQHPFAQDSDGASRNNEFGDAHIDQAQIDPDRVDLVFVDCSARRATVFKDIDYPAVDDFRLAGERFLVGIHNHQVHVLDTQNIDRGYNSIAADAGATFTVGDQATNRFFTMRPRPSAASDIAMFKINDQGKPTPMNRWKSDAPPWQVFESNGKSVFTLSPDGEQIHVRNLIDGESRPSIQIPSEIDTKRQQVYLLLQTLVVESKKNTLRYFDLESRDWIPKPTEDSHLYSVSPDRREYAFFREGDGGNRGFAIYDSQEDAVVSNFATYKAREIIRLDDKRLVEFSRAWGYTTRVIDSTTGQTLQRFRPIAWVAALLTALTTLFVVWALAWTSVSAKEGGWAWLDTLLILGLPALMLLLRFVFVGDTSNLERVPQRMAFGTVMAAQMIAAVWLVFGNTRISLRFLPTILITTLLLALLSVVFPKQPWIAWHVAKISVAPAVCVMLLLGATRLMGWKLQRLVSEDSSEKKASSYGRTNFPLRDLILITVVAALSFAAARPIFDAVEEVYFVNTVLFMPMVLAVFLGMVAIGLGLHQNRKLFAIGVSIATCGLIFACGQPIVAFIDGSPTTRPADAPYLLAPIVGGVGVLAGLIPFRIRHWRLVRMRNPTGSELHPAV